VRKKENRKRLDSTRPGTGNRKEWDTTRRVLSHPTIGTYVAAREGKRSSQRRSGKGGDRVIISTLDRDNLYHHHHHAHNIPFKLFC